MPTTRSHVKGSTPNGNRRSNSPSSNRRRSVDGSVSPPHEDVEENKRSKRQKRDENDEKERAPSSKEEDDVSGGEQVVEQVAEESDSNVEEEDDDKEEDYVPAPQTQEEPSPIKRRPSRSSRNAVNISNSSDSSHPTPTRRKKQRGTTKDRRTSLRNRKPTDLYLNHSELFQSPYKRQSNNNRSKRSPSSDSRTATYELRSRKGNITTTPEPSPVKPKSRSRKRQEKDEEEEVEDELKTATPYDEVDKDLSSQYVPSQDMEQDDSDSSESDDGDQSDPKDEPTQSKVSDESSDGGSQSPDDSKEKSESIEEVAEDELTKSSEKIIVDTSSSDSSTSESSSSSESEASMDERESSPSPPPAPKYRRRTRGRKQNSPIKRQRRSSRAKTQVTRFNPGTPSKKGRYRYRHQPAAPILITDDSSSSSSSSSDSDQIDSSQIVQSGSGATRPKAINMEKPVSKSKIGRNKADIDPMNIDTSVDWNSIGGLHNHVRALKEMIVFPLLYPEIFQKFSITPPRGVIFYGPPGTGKTLVARALANTCSQSGHKVSFYMRKGADCLSKWVGEAERQLRLLFEEASRNQPSIIFFDEIDGLAPVRSAKQDQIHSSIVSTLLALMDGLDSRGQVIVVGATNRIDAIDPALRRPGRFDREFLFALPSREARREIVDIHTRHWKPPPDPSLRSEIADRCVGYCGADIKALCTEAALRALRRRYPQLYSSTNRYIIDTESIIVNRTDFMTAMKDIVPASHRSAVTHARALSPALGQLLGSQFDGARDQLRSIFPHTSSTETADTFFEEDESDFLASKMNEMSSLLSKHNGPAMYRPRFLIHGNAGNAQSQLAAALLYSLEEIPVSVLSMAALFSNPSSKNAEEAFVTEFKESLRKIPSILYLPHIDSWWNVAAETLRYSLINLMEDMDPNLPVLLLATSDLPLKDLTEEINDLFANHSFHVKEPDMDSRRKLFSDLLTDISRVTGDSTTSSRVLEELPIAPALPPKELTEDQLAAKRTEDERALRVLRIFLRNILNDLHTDKKYQFFFKPVNRDQFPIYYDRCDNPIDLSVVLSRLDDSYYINLESFLFDIELLVSNIIEYFPSNDNNRVINRAKGLLDVVRESLEDFDPEIRKICDRITKEREEQNERKEREERKPNDPILRRRKRAKPTEEISKENSSQQDEVINIISTPIENTPTPMEEEEAEKFSDHETAAATRSPLPEPTSSHTIPTSPIPPPEDPVQEILLLNGTAPVQPTPPPAVVQREGIVDKEKVNKIFQVIVSRTEGKTVEQIISLRSRIYHLIYNFRKEVDKSELLICLENLLKNEGFL